MEEYIKGNKEAWEEAFDMRDENWGKDIVSRIQAKEQYAFFNEDTAKVLSKYDLKGKAIGQFCCNNGRELLSLVATSEAAEGIGFDIAENQVAFANEKARELNLPCTFVAQNILDIGDEYRERFDFVIITIGALCWFKKLDDYFSVVSKCMKPGGVIVINEHHPIISALAAPGDEIFDEKHQKDCVFPYFEYEWIGNEGMGYMTGHDYESKTFTDYSHPLCEILGALCNNKMVVTGFQELDYDISEGFKHLDHQQFPLSMIIEGRKEA